MCCNARSHLFGRHFAALRVLRVFKTPRLGVNVGRQMRFVIGKLWGGRGSRLARDERRDSAGFMSPSIRRVVGQKVIYAE